VDQESKAKEGTFHLQM